MNMMMGVSFIQDWLISHQKVPRRLILIAGGSCSGKSYLSESISQWDSTQGKVSILLLDDYFRNITDPRLPHTESGYPLFDSPASYWSQEFVAHTQQLMEGKEVLCPIYERQLNQRAPDSKRSVAPAAILIAEGLFTIKLLKEVFPDSLAIYMEASSQRRLMRRIQRDRNWVAVAKIKQAFWEVIEPAQQVYVENQRHQADLIIET